MIVDLKKLKEISEIEFWDIVGDAIITDINELRIISFNCSNVKFIYIFH